MNKLYISSDDNSSSSTPVSNTFSFPRLERLLNFELFLCEIWIELGGRKRGGGKREREKEGDKKKNRGWEFCKKAPKIGKNRTGLTSSPNYVIIFAFVAFCIIATICPYRVNGQPISIKKKFFVRLSEQLHNRIIHRCSLPFLSSPPSSPSPASTSLPFPRRSLLPPPHHLRVYKYA